MPTTPARARLAALTVLSFGLSAMVILPVRAQSAPSVIVTGVTANHSSARIFYDAVPGAKDYRVYDVANPNEVKYAGLAHYSDASLNNVQDVPSADVEWNELNDTNPHTLIVEAVDAVGPVPQASLYQGPPNGGKTPFAPGGMLGANKGPTLDGKNSTNGQGPYTNHPNAIAQSRPFIVQAQPTMTPLGKIAGASQQYLDTFEQSEASTLQHTAHQPCSDAVDTYVLNGGTAKETNIELRLHDSTFSMPFISNSHFMDMLFSGQTGEGECHGNADITYASLAFTPKQTVNMGPGMILHQTMEVDMHGTQGRWMAFDVSPAGDPIQSWEPDAKLANNAGQALYVDLLTTRLDVRVFNGSTTPAYATTPAVLGDLYIPEDRQLAGRGFDDRSKLDLFVSQTHLAIFQDNKLLSQVNIPAGTMPWFSGAVKTYFTHYNYHSDSDKNFLRTGEQSGLTGCYPMNAYLFNDPVNGLTAAQDRCGIAYPPGYGFPNSDERHWDNLGFEVLPASAAPAGDFSSFGPSQALNQPQPPQFTGGPPPPTSTPAPTPAPTDIPTSTPVPSTPTPVPTGTPVATPTTVVDTCAVVALANGQQQTYTRPLSFCTNQ